MRYYIAGKMRGQRFYNFPAFDVVRDMLKAQGHTVMSPADMDREHGFDATLCPSDTDWSKIPEGFDLQECVDRDLEAVKNCDAIYMLSGWQQSEGASAEHAVAKMRGKKIVYQDSNPNAESSKPTNPKDALGSSKLPLHLWPTTATALGSIGMLNGMLKYGRSNFRAIGVRSSIYYDAARRHLDAWFEGEECDPDDGVPHLAAALSCIAIIVDSGAAGNLNDDRMVACRYRAYIDSLTPHVNRLKELHKAATPKHYTISDNKAVK